MINKLRNKIADIISKDFIDKEVKVWGWIRTSRFSKNVSFIQINDGSSFDSLQLVIDNNELSFDKTGYLTGACITATGIVKKSLGEGQSIEVNVKDIKIFGGADESYPLQKKKHTLEFLRDFPHLRNKTNTFFSLFRVRNELARAIHEYFQDKGFLYTHSPILTVNDCEGAGETFKVSTLNLDNLQLKDGKVNYEEDLFRKPVFLTVSGQLEAEPFALSHGEVYTFGPTFRADPSDTPRHASEFWMIEPEMSFYDIDDLMELIEDFVKYLAITLKERCKKELAFFNEFIETELENRYNTLINEKFAVVTYTEAIQILNTCDEVFENKAVWGEDLFTEHEKYLADKYFKRPVFVTDYPEKFKSFYMRINEDEKTVSCLDLLVPQIGEILTGSQREERYDMLEKRLEKKGMEKSLYNWYLETRRWGTAPHSGFGIGFERVLMYLTGMKNIKDVIPFPRAARKVY